ncbi:MAG: branched-chain amino acid ABC transporter permease [Micrococcales bacterium]|nr:MAG: branched-chain amino acid ABC transporter permease [Micrococcales bacterium]PIE26641.1 MAG: branched-chain amino acid ABC transporter permease [Micrococcales bacterium]
MTHRWTREAGRQAVTPAMRQGIAVGVATGAYGISFGALSVAAGLTVAQTCALSALMFTGGSQFAYVGVVGAGGGGLSAAAAAALLGLRNGVYGLALAPMLRGGAWRPVNAQFTIDESMAVATAQQTRSQQRAGFWSAALAVYVGWNLMTLVGALLGDVLGDPQVWGLDGAAAAAFLGLLWPRLKRCDAVAVAGVAATVAVLMIPLTTPGIPVLVAGATAVAAAVVMTRQGQPPGTGCYPSWPGDAGPGQEGLP